MTSRSNPVDLLKMSCSSISIGLPCTCTPTRCVSVMRQCDHLQSTYSCNRICFHCRVPKLDELIITLSNIARAEHIRDAVGRGPGEASAPSAAAETGSGRQQPADAHSSGAATAGTPASHPLSGPRPPGNASAETPVYATRLGRPLITPGTNTHECAMLQGQCIFRICQHARTGPTMAYGLLTLHC